MIADFRQASRMNVIDLTGDDSYIDLAIDDDPPAQHVQRVSSSLTTMDGANVVNRGHTPRHFHTFDIAALKFPKAVVAKHRKGQTIVRQYNESKWFVKMLDTLNPNQHLTIEQYREAWRYAVQKEKPELCLEVLFKDRSNDWSYGALEKILNIIVPNQIEEVINRVRLTNFDWG